MIFIYIHVLYTFFFYWYWLTDRYWKPSIHDLPVQCNGKYMKTYVINVTGLSKYWSVVCCVNIYPLYKAEILQAIHKYKFNTLIDRESYKGNTQREREKKRSLSSVISTLSLSMNPGISWNEYTRTHIYPLYILSFNPAAGVKKIQLSYGSVSPRARRTSFVMVMAASLGGASLLRGHRTVISFPLRRNCGIHG